MRRKKPLFSYRFRDGNVLWVAADHMCWRTCVVWNEQ